MELDPTDATDKVQQWTTILIKLTTPYGTFGVFVNEGGLDVEDGASQSVYARPTDVVTLQAVQAITIQLMVYNLQYHTASGMLPFGTVIKVGYAPDLDDTVNSGNAKGQLKQNLLQVKVDQWQLTKLQQLQLMV